MKEAGSCEFLVRHTDIDQELTESVVDHRHEKNLGKVTVMVKKVHMDKLPPDGRSIVQRVLDQVVRPVDHIVEGWQDPPNLFVEHRLRVQRMADGNSQQPEGEAVDIYLNDSREPVGTLGQAPKEVPFNDAVTDTVRLEVVPQLQAEGFGSSVRRQSIAFIDSFKPPR